jgi:predicted ester cyclase
MEQIKQNKEFIVRYYNAISGVVKTKELLSEFIVEENLLNLIAVMDGIFPAYELFLDEMMGEDNKVMVRAMFKGIHKGEFKGVAPTNKKVEFPFVITYEIENDKIIHYWMIADNQGILEQLEKKKEMAGE